jgi:hypothetical protein
MSPAKVEKAKKPGGRDGGRTGIHAGKTLINLPLKGFLTDQWTKSSCSPAVEYETTNPSPLTLVANPPCLTAPSNELSRVKHG